MSIFIAYTVGMWRDIRGYTRKPPLNNALSFFFYKNVFQFNFLKVHIFEVE